MLFKKNKVDDDVTRFLMSQGVYSVSRPVKDVERERIKLELPHETSRSNRSFWRGMQYSFLLAIGLWWLPTFGLMIAGYAGGKKTGRPWLGVLSVGIPVGLIYAGIWYIETYDALSSLVASAYLATLTAAPVIGPYFSFITSYIGTLQHTLTASGSFQMSSFLLCMAMAYIGGSNRTITLETGMAGEGIAQTPATQPVVQIITAPTRIQASGAEEEGPHLDSMEKIGAGGKGFEEP